MLQRPTYDPWNNGFGIIVAHKSKSKSSFFYVSKKYDTIVNFIFHQIPTIKLHLSPHFNSLRLNTFVDFQLLRLNITYIFKKISVKTNAEIAWWHFCFLYNSLWRSKVCLLKKKICPTNFLCFLYCSWFCNSVQDHLFRDKLYYSD